MALPIFYPFKTKYYATATTSTSGAPTSTVVVAARCKYVGGYYLPNQIAGTGTNVTGFDVLFATGATSTTVPTFTTISSGVSVTTSTGTFAIPFGPNTSNGSAFSTATVYLNAGDILFTVASTGVGGFITHIVQEF